MSFGAKLDREWLEPLTEEGSRNLEDDELGPAHGCHTGAHEWLNIYNPKEGYTYVWERKKPNDLRRALQKGGQIVRDDDQEMIAARKAAGGECITSVDSMAEYNELQLVRYSDAAMRKIREEQQAKAAKMMLGTINGYTDNALAAETSMECNPRQLKTRFATAEHRNEYLDGDRTRDMWTPDRESID